MCAHNVHAEQVYGVISSELPKDKTRSFCKETCLIIWDTLVPLAEGPGSEHITRKYSMASLSRVENF